MKTSSVITSVASIIAATVVAVLLIGCDQGNVVDSQPAVVAPLSKPIPEYAPGNTPIPLVGLLVEPGRPFSYIEIRGSVEWSTRSTVTKTGYQMNLQTVIAAELIPLEGLYPIWSVSARSENKFETVDGDATVFDSYYAVDGAKYDLYLHLRFRATQKSLELLAQSLEKPAAIDGPILE
jgi:hypothetical protein